MNTLVVYFSRSGHTQQVAGEIARRCGAGLEAIREVHGRGGPLGYLRSAWQALAGSRPSIMPPIHRPAEFELVVIGTPVWCARPAPPVRSYAAAHASQFKRVAFFCTEGRSGDRNVFAEMEGICGKRPIATLAITERQLPGLSDGEVLKTFVQQLTSG